MMTLWMFGQWCARVDFLEHSVSVLDSLYSYDCMRGNRH